MIPPPTFASLQEYIARRGDVGFWRPYLIEILDRHDLTRAGLELQAGYNVTYPTFMYGDVVVKLFGHSRAWQYRDMFRCEQELLRIFLEAAAWPPVDDFPRQALGMALHRQAVGLAQHDTIDVFMPIAEKLPLRDIPTLDDLATVLFAPWCRGTRGSRE